MKQEAKKWLARMLFLGVVATGTLVAGPQIAAARDCPYPSPGTCPPLAGGPSVGTCPDACRDLGWTDGGTCTPVGCCVCFMH